MKVMNKTMVEFIEGIPEDNINCNGYSCKACPMNIGTEETPACFVTLCYKMKRSIGNICVYEDGGCIIIGNVDGQVKIKKNEISRLIDMVSVYDD
jgi:hypothetical protein